MNPLRNAYERLEQERRRVFRKLDHVPRRHVRKAIRILSGRENELGSQRVVVQRACVLLQSLLLLDIDERTLSYAT